MLDPNPTKSALRSPPPNNSSNAAPKTVRIERVSANADTGTRLSQSQNTLLTTQRDLTRTRLELNGTRLELATALERLADLERRFQSLQAHPTNTQPNPSPTRPRKVGRGNTQGPDNNQTNTGFLCSQHPPQYEDTQHNSTNHTPNQDDDDRMSCHEGHPY
jgi:hypothetical protein